MVRRCFWLRRSSFCLLCSRLRWSWCRHSYLIVELFLNLFVKLDWIFIRWKFLFNQIFQFVLHNLMKNAALNNWNWRIEIKIEKRRIWKIWMLIYPRTRENNSCQENFKIPYLTNEWTPWPKLTWRGWIHGILLIINKMYDKILNF